MTFLFKKVWGIVTTTLVVIMVLIAALLAGARLIGMQVFTVITGSMEPNYPVGSIVYVKKVDPTTLQEGDVITFMLNENAVATHRIVEVVPDEENPNVVRFRTKGDNNDIVDNSLVHGNNVIGKVVGKIPYLGYVSDFVQHPPGTYITVAVAAVMIIAVFLPDFLKPEKKEDEAEPSVEEAANENEKLKQEIQALITELGQNVPKQADQNEEDQN